MKIDEIVVKDRVRKNAYVHIKDLMEDIQKNGLINPITINADKVLLAGFRRYTACKALGMEDIPVHMVNTKDEEQDLQVEISENELREDFTMTERLDYARQLQRIEAEKARTRQSTLNGSLPKNSAEAETEKGETRQKVAEKVGMSHDTLRKAQKIEENKNLIDAQDFADWDDGKLSTNKVYQQLKQKLSDAEDKADHMENAYRAAMDNLDREKAKLKKEQENPTVIQKIIEVVPDDYDAIKKDNARLAAERKKFQEEAAEWERKYKESGKTEVALDQQAQKDMDYLTAGIIEFLKNYSGHAWGIDRRASVADHYTADLKVQSMNLLAFAQNLYEIVSDDRKEKKLS
ncbi:ParB/RepB/Spo0J family partition protein [Anaerolactibacter massiliensis]|uniref:ParB/RepB/Spo0J family partition protein n=1 Tax=Anaerolactibacter massiliensis TaxID=2044573 RepID=UPI0014354A59|nr:ParB N-terminal domain-containing protein [Anaerolactibacter massiliensis]